MKSIRIKGIKGERLDSVADECIVIRAAKLPPISAAAARQRTDVREARWGSGLPLLTANHAT